MNQSQNPFLSKRIPILVIWSGLVFFIYVYFNPVRWDALYHNFPYFFLVLRPFTWYGHATDILTVIWIGAVGYSLGCWILNQFLDVREDTHPWEIAVPIGWGLLSLLIFALALIQKLNPSVISGLMILLLFLGFRNLKRKINSSIFRISHWRDFKSSLSRNEIGALLLLAVPLGFAFFSSLMPPTQSDGLRYHLAVPKLYLQHGGFYLLPNLAFSNFPFLIEYLYAIPLAWGSISGPKLIHGSYFFLTLILIYRLGRRLGGRTVGIFAVLILAATPFVSVFASWEFIEFGLTCYTVLAFWFYLEIREKICIGKEENVKGLCCLMGLVGGWMLGCKYTALASLVFLIAAVSLPTSLSKGKARQTAIGRAMRVGLIALVAASPWYIKNLALLGNPVYPFAHTWFPTPNWSEFNAWFFQYHAGLKGNLNAISGAPVWEKIKDIVTLPFRATFFPGEIWHPENFGSWPLGALWLILFPYGWMQRNWDHRRIGHLLFAAFLGFIWAYTYRDSRFLLPALCIAAPIFGNIIYEFISEQPCLRFWGLGILGYGLCWTAGILLIPRTYMPWEVVSGTVSTPDYLEKVSEFVRYENQAFRFLREHTSPNDKVLLHGIDQSFYCPKPFVGADWFNTDPLIAWSWEHTDAESLLRHLQEQKIQYIVYNYGKIQQYFKFYQWFRLPPDRGVVLLKELIANERKRVQYPYLYKEWHNQFMEKLQTAENQAANVKALKQLLDGKMLTEVFRYDENPNNPMEGIVVLKVPEEK